ncbi:hypothetical protein GQ44DRAFT_664182 [Phaeosphaeriaceae sp. PMI808]|nr:hypothetical protein GQ44DRAFT_664182 [Phaeosphaeriaceae sp. PMI808]
MMQLLSRSLFVLLVAGIGDATSLGERAQAYEYTEPANFDPAKALQDRGYNVTQLRQYFSDSQNSSNADCAAAVSILHTLYPNCTLLPNTPQETTWSKGYWSNIQVEESPIIVFQPSRAPDVATAVLVSRWTQCKFAVKSGGHASMKGASNIDGGITIDLVNLNTIDVSTDKKIVALGAGLKWGQVYKELEQYGIQVNGARGSDVGVGGFTTGGGISYFANKYGWGCDNVANYQLVTASGAILHVNTTSYPDLYKALRGGGPNFGIVTRFDLDAFPQGDIFSGSIIYPYSSRAALIPAFSKFAYATDTKVHTWMFVLRLAGEKVFSVLNMYSDPVVDPPIFAPLRNISHIGSDTAVRSVLNMTDSIAAQGPAGSRDMFWSNTFRMDEDFIAWFIEMFYAETENIQGKYAGMNALPVIQFLTKTNLRRWARNGRNALPLRAKDGPYVNIIFALMWQDAKDDVVLINTIRTVMAKAIDEGKSRGLYDDYVYMNYGSEEQDVLKSYGKKAEGYLKGVAAKYDPEEVFQRLKPGYFNFRGPPKGQS